MPRFAYSLLAAGLFLAPLTPGFLAAMAATPGAVQAAQSPTMPGADGNFMGKGQGRNQGGKMAGFLSPEQRTMFALQARDQIKDMPQDQRKAFRKDQVRKVMAMSPADRQKFKMDLQAKWDALPQKQKDRMEKRLAARESSQAAR